MKSWIPALVLGGLVVMPAAAKPKLPEAVAPLPDIEEMLTKAGWTLTPEMSAKFSRPGDILDAKNTTMVDGADCFSAEVKEGAFAKMEVTRSMSAGVRMRVKVVGVRGGVGLEKKIIFDTPIYRQISRFKLVPTAQCAAFIRTSKQRGEDTTSWYVITESLSAVIQQQQCGKYDAKAGTFLVSADASITQACAQTSLAPVAVAYKTMPVDRLLLDEPAAPQPRAAIEIGPVTQTGQAEVEVGGDVDFDTLATRAAQAKAVRESREADLAAEQARLAEAQRKAADALAAERARLAEQDRVAQAALKAAQQERLTEAADKLKARGQKDYASIRSLVEMGVSDETRPVLQAFLKKYEGAKVRVDDLEQAVEVPGVSQVQQLLGVGISAEEQAFEKLKADVARLEEILQRHGTCPKMIELGATQMGTMILEQAQMVIDAEEVDMAADVLQFFDQAMPQIDQIIPQCP